MVLAVLVVLAVLAVFDVLAELLDRAVCGRRVLLEPVEDAASSLLPSNLPVLGLCFETLVVSGDRERRFDGVVGSGVSSWRSEAGPSRIDRALVGDGASC